MNNTNKITPTFLSYAGGGVQPNFSAVGRKQQFPQSNGANSAVGKKLSIVNLQLSEANCPLSIVNCKLSIVHYPLLILLCLLFSASAFAEFGGGTGSAGDPYIISSLTHLNTLADNVNGGSYHYEGVYFKVTEDITSTAMSKVIGGGGGSKYFSGIFDGNNKRIKLGINITSEYSQYIGLFGYIKGATIRNVKLEGTLTSAKWYAGSIAGYATDDCVIENCFSSVVVTVNAAFAAGIVGNAYNTTITDCTNTGSISGTVNVGGISGTVQDCTISNCSNTGAVTGASSSNYRGGVVGTASSSDFIDCENSGSVTGLQYIGGIVGNFGDSSEPVSNITGCTNSGAITATSNGYVGGIVGNIPNLDGYVVIDECANTGNVIFSGSSNYRVGGLVGFCGRPAKVYNSYNTANISCTGNLASDYLYMGGLIGELSQYVEMKNCYNIGDVRGKNDNGQYIGGAAGTCNGTMQNCYNGGIISRNYATNGAIVGYIYANASISNVYYLKNCGTASGITVFGTKATAADSPTNYSDFTHNNTTNTLSSSITVNGTSSNDLLTVLKAWVTANGSDYLTWVDASSNSDNKGMPKFYSCTPVPDPSLSVTQTNTGGRELRVSWTATDGVSYTLYYGVNDPNSGLENVYDAGTQTSPYTALRLTNGVEYHFAIKPTGTGDYCADNPLSSTVSATPECNE